MISSMLLACLVSGSNVTIEGGGTILDDKAVKQPVVLYIGEINEETARGFVAGLYAAQETGQTVIPVFISSYGGSVYALIEMIDAIKLSKVPIATIAVGKAMSAGAILLAMGSPGMRYAAPNATIMIHEVSGGSMGKVGDMTVDTAEANRLNALMFKLAAENLGKPSDFFTKLIAERARADWFITAKEALDLGIINKIGVPDLKVKIKIRTVLEE